jgi:hypothetical protein
LVGAVCHILLGGICVLTSTSRIRTHKIAVIVIGAFALLGTFESFLGAQEDLKLYAFRDNRGVLEEWREWGREGVENWVEGLVMEYDPLGVLFKGDKVEVEEDKRARSVEGEGEGDEGADEGDEEEEKDEEDKEVEMMLDYFWHRVQMFSDDEYCPRYKSLVFHHGDWTFNTTLGALYNVSGVGWEAAAKQHFQPESFELQMAQDGTGQMIPMKLDGSDYVNRCERERERERERVREGKRKREREREHKH